jgi:hypothetical protein
MVTAEVTRQDAREVALSVRVAAGGGETRHEVTVSRADLARLAHADESPERFVERCFAFLLEREPKESILRRFDVSVIGRYFREFESIIRR